MTRRVLVIFAFLSLAAMNSAQAADMPVKIIKPAPVFSWSGWYAGAHAGYGWGDPSVDFDPATAPRPAGSTTVVSLGAPFRLETHPRGWLAGLQLGYNKQYGKIVVGIEGDITWANIKDSDSGSYVNTFVTQFPDTARTNGTVTLESKLNWLATLRGRVGYTFDTYERVLPYLTGGLAVGHVKTSVTNAGTNVFLPPPPAATAFSDSASLSDTLWGFAVGAGVDWAITERWIVRAEYLYVNLQGKSHATPLAGMSTLNTGMDLNIARLAVNYRFKPE